MSGPQGGERLREQAAGRGGERADQQLADGPAVLRLQIGVRQLHLRQDAVRVLAEQPARVGETDAAAVPGEEALARLALQLGHLLGHRGRRHVQRLGGGADRAVLADGVQDAQPVDVQHLRNATFPCR